MADLELNVTRASLQLRHAMLARNPAELQQTLTDIADKRRAIEALMSAYEAALSTPEERHIQDHNFAPVFPIWDILFGTAIYDGKHRPTGVDDAVVDADNGRGWLAQQVTVLGRLARALVPGIRRSSMQPGLGPPAE